MTETHEKRTETHARDLISRQAALDALRDRYYKYDRFAKIEELAWAIEALPSAQQWIPCSRELPKKDGQYIVTVKYEHVDGYEDIYSEHGEWVDGHWDAGFGYYHCGRVEKVLAWQPMPIPYREGEKETDGEA